jgi:hypothetical protein
MVSPILLMKPMASQASLLDLVDRDFDPSRYSSRREQLQTPDIDNAGIVGPEYAFQCVANQLLKIVSVRFGVGIDLPSL